MFARSNELASGGTVLAARLVVTAGATTPRKSVAISCGVV